MWNILIENLPKRFSTTPQHKPPGYVPPHVEALAEFSKNRSEDRFNAVVRAMRQKFGGRKTWTTMDAMDAFKLSEESCRNYMKRMVAEGILGSIVIMQPNKHFLFYWEEGKNVEKAED